MHVLEAITDDLLPAWIAVSPDHFYLTMEFPHIDVQVWNYGTPISCENLHVCTSCTADDLRKFHETMKFLGDGERRPLRTLDLFGGVGGFGLGMAEGSGCMKITHAVEISPSAAKTFKCVLYRVSLGSGMIYVFYSDATLQKPWSIISAPMSFLNMSSKLVRATILPHLSNFTTGRRLCHPRSALRSLTRWSSDSHGA